MARLRDFAAAGLSRAGRPVDIASLVAFRALFGAVMFASAIRFIAKGWIETQLVGPRFHFTYALFAFVEPWPAPWMLAHFALVALAALGVAVGLWYRTSAILLFVGFSYVELVDKATYLNHYYLVTLLAGLLLVMPAAAAFSIDARRRPDTQRAFVPAWVLYALRLQVGVVYVYAGLAKLNGDWLLRAEPLRIWLAARSDLPVIGPLLAIEPTAFIASWLGAAFDLGIVGLLLFRRTRSAAFVTLVCFHVVTAVLLPIGMFPWIMIAAATVFLDPGWPRRFIGGMSRHTETARVPKWIATVVAVHCLLQLAIPLRGAFAHAPSAWTTSGFNFAWKVMVAEKSGVTSFRVRNRATGETMEVEPKEYLTVAQERAMAQDPEMIRALALEVARDFRERWGADVAVFADSFASLNGRPSAPLINSQVDLTGEPRPGWILPLENQ